MYGVTIDVTTVTTVGDPRSTIAAANTSHTSPSCSFGLLDQRDGTRVIHKICHNDERKHGYNLRHEGRPPGQFTLAQSSMAARPFLYECSYEALARAVEDAPARLRTLKRCYRFR